jgi:phage shock protein PspC (stress-responsive transcriptional regulator)
MQLLRAQEDRYLAGVCGGLAHEFGLASGRLRLVWILATIFTAFAGVIVYLALWYLIPKEPPVEPNFKPAVLQPWKKNR